VAEERKPFLLRLPPDLHRALQAWAEQEMRSVNGQIEYLLRDALRRRAGGGGSAGEGGIAGGRGSAGENDPQERTSAKERRPARPGS
jgi:hypothetical protein